MLARYLTPDEHALLNHTGIPGTGGVGDLDDLTDVVITTPASGDVIQYDGTHFVNSPLSIAGDNILKTIVDAKGDLIVGSAADTVVRKAAGTDGFQLIADSTQGDGLKWVTSACSQSATWEGALTVGAGTRAWTAPFDLKILAIYVFIVTAPTGASALFNARKNSTALYASGNRITVAAAANTGSASTFVSGANDFTAGDLLRFDVDQIGSTVAGSDAIFVWSYRAR